MSITRRQSLRQSAMMAAAFLSPPASHRQPIRRPSLDPSSLAPFVDPLPIPKFAQPNGYRPSPVDSTARVPYYRLPMQQIVCQVHRDLKPTRCWGIDSYISGSNVGSAQRHGNVR